MAQEATFCRDFEPKSASCAPLHFWAPAPAAKLASESASISFFDVDGGPPAVILYLNYSAGVKLASGGAALPGEISVRICVDHVF